MIKGHSGTGSKVQVQQDILRLSDIRSVPAAMRDYPSGSSSSDSPGREDSVESEPMYPSLSYQLTQSSIRGMEDCYGHSGTSDSNQSSPSLRNIFVDLLSPRCDSPMDPSVQYEFPTSFSYPMVTEFDSEMFDFYSNL